MNSNPIHLDFSATSTNLKKNDSIPLSSDGGTRNLEEAALCMKTFWLALVPQGGAVKEID